MGKMEKNEVFIKMFNQAEKCRSYINQLIRELSQQQQNHQKPSTTQV